MFVQFEHKYLQILMFRYIFHSQLQWFDQLIKQIKKNSRDQQVGVNMVIYSWPNAFYAFAQSHDRGIYS